MIDKTLSLFEPSRLNEEYSIDYYQFAQQWIDFFDPYINKIKITKRRNAGAVSLIHLKERRNAKNINFNDDVLVKIIENAPYRRPMWENIASCILGVREEKRKEWKKTNNKERGSV